MSEKDTCHKRVSRGSGFHMNTQPCGNKAKYQEPDHEGHLRWYCGIHAPSKKKARAEKRGPTQWERECAERKRVRDRSDMLPKVVKVFAAYLGITAHFNNIPLHRLGKANDTLTEAKALLSPKELEDGDA